MTAAQRIALWADKLRDVSATGLRFCQVIYDRERYQAVQDVAMAMHAFATGEAPASIEPLRGPIFSRPTPLVGADAAVIDEAGRMLLIRRADDGLWAMPGGALEVGETPAEGATREALEETGVPCRALALAGVWDSRLCGSRDRHHLYHFVFVCRPLGLRAEPAVYAFETRGQAWFAEADLPATMSPGHAVRIAHAFRVWRGRAGPHFDAEAGLPPG